MEDTARKSEDSFGTGYHLALPWCQQQLGLPVVAVLSVALPAPRLSLSLSPLPLQAVGGNGFHIPSPCPSVNSSFRKLSG